MSELAEWQASHVTWHGERARLRALERAAADLDGGGRPWFSVEGLAPRRTELVVHAPAAPAPGTAWHRPCVFATPLFGLDAPADVLLELLTVQTARSVRIARRHADEDPMPSSVVLTELAAGYEALVPRRAARRRALTAHANWLDRTMSRQGWTAPDQAACTKTTWPAVGEPSDRRLTEAGRRLYDELHARDEGALHEVVARLMHLQVTRLCGANSRTVLPREARYVAALCRNVGASLPAAHDG